MVAIAVVFFLLAAGALGVVAYFVYQRKLRRAKAIERGLKMVPILIHLPPPSSDTAGGNRDIREVMREKTSQAEVLYNLMAGTATEGFKSNFYGQRHVALELIASNGLVHFYAAVPVALVSTISKAIQTAYPGARLEEAEDHNIFNQEGRLAATMGGEMVLKAESAYPLATYAQMERDPMEALVASLATLKRGDGAAVQIMLRPASPHWVKQSADLADKLRKGRAGQLKFGAMDLAKAVLKAPTPTAATIPNQPGQAPVQANLSNLELSAIEAVEEKTKHAGFEVLVRVIVSTETVAKSQQLLRDIATAFALFDRPGSNGFKFLPAFDVQGLVTAFIFRFFPPELRSNMLNSQELATLFHLPDSQFTPTANVQRQQSKQVDGPVQLPTEGLLFGYNEFRGVKKEIRLSAEDRRRHTYILGQTGTGKSTMLENLAVQDMLAGNGFAFIDPHGDTAEKLLSMVPKHRAEDVIYFNPADTEFPLGLNLFEFTDNTQKDFLVQETINMLYKLYDPGHTGIIGPRYEHWYRNAALTLMSDPNGATFIEIPKVFTDTEYLKQKFKYLKDPTVIDFWTKEMGQTSDYHKSEMLGWFVSKFGAFQNNEMMRNIIGQTKSAFNLREVMDQKKILIVNLSKGRVGELNSQLLGMIFVIKFQAAAMSRADRPEYERPDFSLYVDEFQNFSTDSFASILSEARKYHLNLIVANQFIGQLSNEVRDAVFGNIGSIVAHRMGPEDAEFMVKQFAPVFDAGDLVNIPNYNAAMRLMTGGVPSQPFTIQNLPPLGKPNAELGMAIKQLSAAKHGVAKNVVEADILVRLSGQPIAPPPPRPAAPVSAAVPAPALVVPEAPVAIAPAPVAAVIPPAPSLPPVVDVPVGPAGPVAAAADASRPVPVMDAVRSAAGPAPQLSPVAAVVVPESHGANIPPAPEAAAPISAVPGIPPIGAPPIDLPPIAATPQPAAPSTAAITAAPEPSAQTLVNIAQTPPPIGAPPVEFGAPAPAAVDAIMPPVTNTAGQAMEPAAPIIPEEPAVAPAVAEPVAASQVGTLSITDITGGKSLPNPVPVDDILNIPLIPPGSGPLVSEAAATPAQEASVSGPAVPAYDPALDPLADVPLLGEAPIVAAQQVAAQPKSAPMPPVGPIELPVPPPPTAPEQTFSMPPAPVKPAQVDLPAPSDAVVKPVAPAMPIDLPMPAPVAPAVSAPPFLSTAFEPPARPAATSAPSPAAWPVASEVPVESIDLVAEPAKPAIPDEPVVSVPEPARPEPVRTTVPQYKAAPEHKAAPELKAEDLIHFVNPELETVLERSVEDAPRSESNEMLGKEAAATLAAVVSGSSNPPLAQPANVPAAPAVAAPPVSVAPQAAIAAPTPAPSTPAIVQAPPPIGAPPVDLIQTATSDRPVPTVTFDAGFKLPKEQPMAAPPIQKPAESPVAPSNPAPAAENIPAPVATLESDRGVVKVPAPAASAPAPVAPSAPPASAPSQPAATPAPTPAPTPTPTPEVVVVVQPMAPKPAEHSTEKNAEHKIDELLSSSLIEPTAAERPLPELKDEPATEAKPAAKPVAPEPESADRGRHWLAPVDAQAQTEQVDQEDALPAAQPPVHHASYTTSHKVIQPLEPIVPRREELMQEAAELLAEEARAAAAAAGEPVEEEDAKQQESVPEQTAKPSDQEQQAEVMQKGQPLPAESKPEPAADPSPASQDAPKDVVQTTAVTEPAAAAPPQGPVEATVAPEAAPEPEAELPPAQSLAASALEQDVELPQAESLAAEDVARVQVEKAQESPAPEAATAEPAAHEDQQGRGRRKRRRGGHEQPAKPEETQEQPADKSESAPTPEEPEKKQEAAQPEDPTDPKGSEASAELTGKLILPSAPKPDATPVVAPKADEKPPKLAKGEVYVDEHGNVVIGE